MITARRLLAIAFVCASTLFGLHARAAESTNFSYSTLSVGLGTVKIAPSVCIFADCYSTLGGAQFGGAYQFADGLLVVSLNAFGAAASTTNTSLSLGGSTLGLSLVKGIGSRVDVTVGIASLSSSAEACLGSLCAKASDSGTGLLAGVQVWFDDARRFSGALTLNSATYTENSTRSTGSALGLSYYITPKHAVAMAFANSDSTSNTGSSQTSSSMLTYTYHFNAVGSE